MPTEPDYSYCNDRQQLAQRMCVLTTFHLIVIPNLPTLAHLGTPLLRMIYRDVLLPKYEFSHQERIL